MTPPPQPISPPPPLQQSYQGGVFIGKASPLEESASNSLSNSPDDNSSTVHSSSGITSPPQYFHNSNAAAPPPPPQAPLSPRFSITTIEGAAAVNSAASGRSFPPHAMTAADMLEESLAQVCFSSDHSQHHLSLPPPSYQHQHASPTLASAATVTSESSNNSAPIKIIKQIEEERVVEFGGPNNRYAKVPQDKPTPHQTI